MLNILLIFLILPVNKMKRSVEYQLEYDKMLQVIHKK